MSVCPLAFEKLKLEPTEYFRIRHDNTDGHCQDTAGWQDGFSGVKPKPKPSAHFHFYTSLHNFTKTDLGLTLIKM